jgi:hypothetical protein
MSLVLQSSGGGQITIQEPATASNFTQTLPAATGTVMVSGNQPAFSAFSNNTQTFTAATATKININTEVFDTANAFDKDTNYRFQPQVAGYYQMNGCAYFSAPTISSFFIFIFANGAIFKYGNGISATSIGASFATVNDLIYLNGSTDYLELYGFLGGTGTLSCNAGSTFTYFSGSLVRAA